MEEFEAFITAWTNADWSFLESEPMTPEEFIA